MAQLGKEWCGGNGRKANGRNYFIGATAGARRLAKLLTTMGKARLKPLARAAHCNIASLPERRRTGVRCMRWGECEIHERACVFVHVCAFACICNATSPSCDGGRGYARTIVWRRMRERGRENGNEKVRGRAGHRETRSRSCHGRAGVVRCGARRRAREVRGGSGSLHNVSKSGRR